MQYTTAATANMTQPARLFINRNDFIYELLIYKLHYNRTKLIALCDMAKLNRKTRKNLLISRKRYTFATLLEKKATQVLDYGVMVAQQVLVLFVQVRILVVQPRKRRHPRTREWMSPFFIPALRHPRHKLHVGKRCAPSLPMIGSIIARDVRHLRPGSSRSSPATHILPIKRIKIKALNKNATQNGIYKNKCIYSLACPHTPSIRVWRLFLSIYFQVLPQLS